jgi:hypothetical protein
MDTDVDLLLMCDDVRRVPLDSIPLDEAEELIHRVFDRQHDEPVVGVARFGSSI